MFTSLWNSGIVNPMTNALLMLYDLLGNNFFLALTAFTVATRLIMLPLNLRSQRSMMKSQEMQPQIQAIQKKYKDNPTKMQEEFARIGYNPADALSGCLPMFIQMPIFIGLYRAIFYVLPSTPQGLFELSQRAYDFIDLTAIMPVSNKFLWLNLAQPDPMFILPVLVGGTMYLQQKLMAPTPAAKTKKKSGAADEVDTAQSIQQSMQVTMPLMFGFIALSFASGLSIYFIVSNLIGIVQGYVMRRNKESLKLADAAQNKNASSKKQAVEVAQDNDAQGKNKNKNKKKKKKK